MQKELEQLAKDIIENNQYMTIASVGSDGNPWASAVCYAYDPEYTFYWVSQPSSKHQTNFQNHSQISFTIFDSHQDWGEGMGVQGEAIVQKVKLTEISNVFSIFFERDYPYGKTNVLSAYGNGLKALLNGKIYHFYKAMPTKVWVPDPNADGDARIEVDLNIQ